MKSFNTLALFAAVAVAQNEFPDPDYEPNPNITPVDQTAEDVRPFIAELFAIRAGVITLDKAIIAFDGPEDVAPTLQTSQDLLDIINAQAADALTHPQSTEDITTDAGINATGPILDYANSLIYHINHTAVNIVLKEDVAVKYCQGPTVLAAIEDQATAAQGFINNFIPKLPSGLQDLAPTYVQPIFDALSSASLAYADQTTTSSGCTPPATSTSTSSTSTTSSTATTTGTASAGSGSDVWATWDSVTTLKSSYMPTATGSSSKPTDESDDDGYEIVCEDVSSSSSSKGSYASPTAAPSSYTAGNYSKPAPTSVVSTYTGASVANHMCISTVVLTALAALLL